VEYRLGKLRSSRITRLFWAGETRENTSKRGASAASMGSSSASSCAPCWRRRPREPPRRPYCDPLTSAWRLHRSSEDGRSVWRSPTPAQPVKLVHIWVGANADGRLPPIPSSKSCTDFAHVFPGQDTRYVARLSAYRGALPLLRGLPSVKRPRERHAGSRTAPHRNAPRRSDGWPAPSRRC
jgi:hypothetical protein